MYYIPRSTVQRNNSDQQRVFVEKLRVFVDFHNADAQGRLRLNCIGTIEDLAAQKIELRSDQQLTLYSEDLEVSGIVEYSNSEHLWVAAINWDEIRQVEEVNSVQNISSNSPNHFAQNISLNSPNLSAREHD